MCGFVKYASDSLVTMPNQRAVRHSREALHIATKPRRVAPGALRRGTETPLRISHVRELVSDRVLRKSLPCDA
jgi:hypothetical protein